MEDYMNEYIPLNNTEPEFISLFPPNLNFLSFLQESTQNFENHNLCNKSLFKIYTSIWQNRDYFHSTSFNYSSFESILDETQFINFLYDSILNPALSFSSLLCLKAFLSLNEKAFLKYMEKIPFLKCLTAILLNQNINVTSPLRLIDITEKEIIVNESPKKFVFNCKTSLEDFITRSDEELFGFYLHNISNFLAQLIPHQENEFLNILPELDNLIETIKAFDPNDLLFFLYSIMDLPNFHFPDSQLCKITTLLFSIDPCVNTENTHEVVLKMILLYTKLLKENVANLERSEEHFSIFNLDHVEFLFNFANSNINQFPELLQSYASLVSTVMTFPDVSQNYKIFSNVQDMIMYPILVALCDSSNDHNFTLGLKAIKAAIGPTILTYCNFFDKGDKLHRFKIIEIILDALINGSIKTKFAGLSLLETITKKIEDIYFESILISHQDEEGNYCYREQFIEGFDNILSFGDDEASFLLISITYQMFQLPERKKDLINEDDLNDFACLVEDSDELKLLKEDLDKPQEFQVLTEKLYEKISNLHERLDLEN